MKKISVFILGFVLLSVFLSCESQKSVSDIIYNKYNGQDGFTMWALPPNFVDKFVSKEKSDQKELLNQVRDFKLMIFNDEVEGKKSKSVFEEVNELLNKRNFEDMMSINREGNKITIKIQEKKEVIREMHVLVRGEENFFIASLTGRIDMNTINRVMSDSDLNFDDFGNIKSFTEDFDFDEMKFLFQ